MCAVSVCPDRCKIEAETSAHTPVGVRADEIAQRAPASNILRVSDRIIIFSTSSLLQNAVGFQASYIQVSVVCFLLPVSEVVNKVYIRVTKFQIPGDQVSEPKDSDQGNPPTKPSFPSPVLAVGYHCCLPAYHCRPYHLPVSVGYLLSLFPCDSLPGTASLPHLSPSEVDCPFHGEIGGNEAMGWVLACNLTNKPCRKVFPPGLDWRAGRLGALGLELWGLILAR